MADTLTYAMIALSCQAKKIFLTLSNPIGLFLLLLFLFFPLLILRRPLLLLLLPVPRPPQHLIDLFVSLYYLNRTAFLYSFWPWLTGIRYYLNNF